MQAHLHEEYVVRRKPLTGGPRGVKDPAGNDVDEETFRANASPEDVKYLEAVMLTNPLRDRRTLASLSFAHFGYEYGGDDGVLRNKTTGAPFHFIDQAHYEALGDCVLQHVTTLLQTPGLGLPQNALETLPVLVLMNLLPLIQEALMA